MNAFFYPSVNGDRVYDATAFEHWLKKFFTTGVFLNDLQVTANDDMTVNVGTGYANVDAKVKMFEADTTLQIETAGATYPRIDSIVLERNDTERDVLLKVIKGGYSSEPIAQVPVRQDGVYQLVIAQIRVNAGAVKITQLDITDTRSNKELCGIVAGAVDQIDFSQIQAQFDAYMVEYAEYIADYAEQMQADFDAWFENIRNQLDEDAAGHLQNQIDGINEQLKDVGGSRVEVTVSDVYGKYNVVGLTVNLEIDGKTYSKKVPSEKVVVFQVLEIGTASISCVDEAQGYRATGTIEIPCYSAYEKTLESGGHKVWIESVGYTIEQYPTIADVLADEKVVRKLMTVHASCDVFVDWYNEDNSMLSQFTANRVAMKWIGLRDYIADKIMSIPSALEQLLASEYWEYILKDKVSTMTSDTAPEGVASSSGAHSADYAAWHAFDNVNSARWQSVSNITKNAWLQYKFTNPITVRKLMIHPYIASNKACVQNFKVQASNDGTNFVDLYSGIVANSDAKQYFEFENSTPYLYYRLLIVDAYSGSGVIAIKDIQFYGRSLNESVPVMTSDNTPLGKVSASDENATYRAYLAFEKAAGARSYWGTNINNWIQYKFIKQTVVRSISILPFYYNGNAYVKNFVLQASNDGEKFVDLYTGLYEGDGNELVRNIYNNTPYLYYRLMVVDTYAADVAVNDLQFYGVSYSEEEFGSDGIEMLYDNGVEVAPISIYEQANATVTKHDDYVMNVSSAKDNGAGGIEAQVNFDNGYKNLITDYDGKIALAGVALKVGDIATTYTNIYTNTRTDSETITSGKALLDVSSMSGENKVCAMLWIGVVENIGKELAKIRKLYLIK